MRFQLHRSPSLRKLRTAFSRSATPSSSTHSSPDLGGGRAWSPATSDCPSHASHASHHSSSSIREILALRRAPSGVEMELEEEARSFPDEVGLLEPRPEAPPTTRGLFEVLDGSD